MTDIEMTYWENCGWVCPRDRCDGLLELADDRDDSRKRPGVREPLVQCYDCKAVYDVEFSRQEES